MFRLLLAALILYGLVTLWRRHVAQLRRPSRRTADAPASATSPSEMVACARCGTFVLKSETIDAGGTCYCTDACRKGDSA